MFIIFYFQQLLFMTNFDQTHGYRDRIIFGDTFDRVILLVTLFHRSIDRAILLVTLFDPSQFGDTLCVFHFQKKYFTIKKTAALFGDTIFGDTFSVSPSPKINFGTFQLGIAQLVPRVSGSPSPPSPLPAPKSRKKKKNSEKRKKVPTYLAGPKQFVITAFHCMYFLQCKLIC